MLETLGYLLLDLGGSGGFCKSFYFVGVSKNRIPSLARLDDVHVCTYIYIHTHTHVLVYMYVNIHLHMCTSTYVCISTYVCMYVYMYVLTHLHVICLLN